LTFCSLAGLCSIWMLHLDACVPVGCCCCGFTMMTEKWECHYQLRSVYAIEMWSVERRDELVVWEGMWVGGVVVRVLSLCCSSLRSVSKAKLSVDAIDVAQHCLAQYHTEVHASSCVKSS